ncbi:MAG TPA: helix-hairpin-helix domain-containing protein, partial [Chitinophagaceae bacterium]
IRLGVQEKIANRIRHYIEKGGHFRVPQDIRKIYGLDPRIATRLEPFVRIPSGDRDANLSATTTAARDRGKTAANSVKGQAPGHVSGEDHRADTERHFDSGLQRSVERKSQPLDVNTADSLAFVRLRGIGPRLAARIINFRTRLGGFYSIEQVGETYGLPDSTYQSIRQFLTLRENDMKKLPLNTAAREELASHPYIRWAIAGAIVSYRTEHGAFRSIDELKNVPAITPEVLAKLRPYLALQ